MLDFIIVMGHVPGTNIDLTFYELCFLIPVAAGLIYMIRKRPLVLKRLVLEAYIGGRQVTQQLYSKLSASFLAR